MEQQAQDVLVQFSGSASPFHAGDVAGFTAAEAKQYVDKGVAQYYDQESAERATAVAPPPVANGTKVKASKPAKAVKSGAASAGGEPPPPDGGAQGAAASAGEAKNNAGADPAGGGSQE